MSIDLIQTRLIPHNMLFVIPSWGDLLGYPTLGNYVNHYVSKIHSDLVIFLTGLESSIEIEIPTEVGPELRTYYYLFGLGYYYTKFELQSGRYIIDNRQLTGLILSDFVYDYLATSKNITLENDPDVIIADKLIKVPLDLSNKSITQRSFIKGALMRNLFIPYKDIFLELMETIQKHKSYQLGQGSILLSTHMNNFNKILISTKMMEDKRDKFMESTAGINEIILGADNHLKRAFTPSERQKINDKLLSLKEIYSTINFDPMYLYSIIDNASKVITDDSYRSRRVKAVSAKQKTPKESVLISAENRLNSIIPWPQKFKRNTKIELEQSAIYKEFKDHPPIVKPAKFSEENLTDSTEFGKDTISDEEKFELRTQKRPVVESKPLPKPEKDDVFIILLYLKEIIEKDYDIQSIGKAFEIARDKLRNIILQSKFMWEMGKYANLYSKFEESNVGLSQNEKRELIQNVDGWIENIIKEKEDFIKKK